MSERSASSRLVLVVEADQAAQRRVATLLTNLGYEPLVTASVAESMVALSQTQFLLSLVNLDLDGSDGTELLRRLKSEGGHPGSVVVIANGGSLKRVAEASALGAQDVLQKPFSPEDLENVIKSAAASPARLWGNNEPSDDRSRKLQEELGLWQSEAMRE